MKLRGWIGRLGIALMIIGMLGMIYFQFMVEHDIEIVDCYDDHGNKIIGLECEEDWNVPIWVVLIIPLGIIASLCEIVTLHLTDWR